MRTSRRTAILSCAALLGLGSLVGLPTPAEASPTGIPPIVATPQGGTGPHTGLDLTTPTTKPGPTPPLQGEIVLVDPDPTPPKPFDDVEGQVVVDAADAVDPDPEPECPAGVACPEDDPDCVPVPGGPDCPEDEPDCATYVECCEQDITLNPERPCPGDEDPCEERPGQAVRSAEDCCPDPGRPNGEDEPQRSREDCPETGTDGGDGGSTDGGGRLPKTGAEMATYGLAGLGFVGIGALLKRLGRKTA